MDDRARRVFAPAAFGCFIAGFAPATWLFFGRQAETHLTDAVISTLLSREDNPAGFLYAAAGTALWGALMLPVASAVQRGVMTQARSVGLGKAGTWVLRLGLTAAVAVGVTSPADSLYAPMHINLAFAAFMSTTLGLALLCAAIASGASGSAKRAGYAALAGVQAGVLVFLTYVFFTPDFFANRGPWTGLAACEWGLCILITLATWTVVRGSGGAVQSRSAVVV